jgi:toxin ParE1/3/4
VEFKVILTPQALADLQEILAYIAQDNPVAAQKLHEELRREAFSLKTFPLRGARVKAYAGVRFLVCGNYLIVYWVKDHQVVQILRFWHAARDIRRLQF